MPESLRIHAVLIADAPCLPRAFVDRDEAREFAASVARDYPGAVPAVRSMELLKLPAPTDEMVERAARAIFDALEQDDTLVRCGGLPARSWDDLPDGCQEHEHHRTYVRVALTAAFQQELSSKGENA